MKSLTIKRRQAVLLILATAGSISFSYAASPFETEGKFSVGSDGSANYSIPIVVPPGTAGMQPQLALNYSSNGGNGIVGMGWGIDGLSQISRCPTTLEQDGVINGVNYTNTDRFCLDGQRLIATTDTYNATTKQYTTTSAYGANGTEYRTESANFAKIISYGQAGTGPAYFKVWTKSGQIIEYGNSVDSGIEAQGKPTLRTWGVNKISDTKGNYIAVTYTEDNANGEAYVQKIDYTGNTTSTPALIPYANIQFIYETRPDITTGYQAGSVLKTTKRLTNIQTYNATTLIKNYKLSYELSQSTKRSRLKTLTECDGNGITPNCKQPATIGWESGDSFFGNLTQWATNTFNPNNEWFTTSIHDRVYVMDVNGDGLPDIMGISNNYVGVQLNNGTSFGPVTQWATNTFNPNNEWFSTSIQNRVYVTDVNGDGLPDIMGISNNYVGVQSTVNSVISKQDSFTSLLPNLLSTTYKPLTDSSIYSKDTIGASGSGMCPMPVGKDNGSNSYPIQNVQVPAYVVSSAASSDGLGGVVTSTYQYGGLKSHVRGRGSLGFRYVKESSPDSGLGVTTFYRQDFPFIGLPCQVEKRRLSDNALLSVVQNTYANSDLATSTIISKFPYLSQSLEQAYELDGALVSTTTTTNQYDSYGNVTSVKVDDGLGNIKTTTSTYNNNVGNWLLGRLIRSTVTSVTP